MHQAGGVVGGADAGVGGDGRGAGGAAGGAGGLTVVGIVGAAVALGDLEGVEAVSMRRIAERLGAGVMSLYRHVRSQVELVDLMVDQVFGERELPELDGWSGPGSWRAKLELSARMEWDVYRDHPWVARLVASTTRPPLAPNRMAYTDWRIRALEGTGLPFETMAQISFVLSTQVHGVALGLEAETDALRTSDLTRDEWTATRQDAVDQALRTRHLPMIARFGQPEYEASTPDRIFDFGLTRLLDGIAVLIPDEARAK
ncbi:TetR/AcrR family transcriptional regulator [Kribbella hippodromi]